MTATASSTSTRSSLDNGRPRRWLMRLTAAVRMAIGLIFVTAGLPKFFSHGTWLRLFEHWQVPLPNVSVYAVGGFEVVAGVLLVLGVGSSLVAALFVIDMIGALTFAGSKDGAAFIVEPAVLGTVCLLFALIGAGAWQLRAAPTLIELWQRRM